MADLETPTQFQTVTFQAHQEFCPATVSDAIEYGVVTPSFGLSAALFFTTVLVAVKANALRLELIKAKKTAHTDALTQLMNRHGLEANLDGFKAIANRYNNKIATIVMDLDKFKLVNDTHGHPVGDQLLKLYATVLRETFRESDLIARFGGEEFLVIALLQSEHVVTEMLTRLQANYGEAIGQSDLPFSNASFSAGVVISNPDEFELKAILDEVDAALYTAKDAGRARVSIGNKICELAV
jgi:diguanylate cyclase (GGDEF)-like protein